MAYHSEKWRLEDIGIKTPDNYANPKRRKRKIEKTQLEICEEIRSELNKVQLMIPNKESMII